LLDAGDEESKDATREVRRFPPIGGAVSQLAKEAVFRGNELI
jgi:hypothetical protein